MDKIEPQHIIITRQLPSSIFNFPCLVFRFGRLSDTGWLLGWLLHYGIVRRNLGLVKPRKDVWDCS